MQNRHKAKMKPTKFRKAAEKRQSVPHGAQTDNALMTVS